MKSYEQVLKELNDIFRIVFKNNSIVISRATTAADIKEWDSLNHMHLIAAIEEHFKCEFDFEEVVNFKNVGDVILTLQKKEA